MEPTNRHATPGVVSGMQMHEVDAALAVVHENAHVSDDAVIGTPGEWRGRVSGFPAVIERDAVVREFATVHAGVERATVVGENTLLMTKAHVGHDAVIGRDCDIGVSAVVGGCCTIGDRVKIGLGATVKPHVTIGDGARIGMGAAVVRDVPAGEVWAGVPARRIR